MICHLCHAGARGFGFQPPGIKKQVHACSMACLNSITQYYKENKKMIDTTPDELEANRHGMNMAQEYAQSIGVSDVALMASDQRETFFLCHLNGFRERLRELHRIPF